MAVVTLLVTLFLGFLLGVVLMAMLSMAKDQKAEHVGAAGLAVQVIERINLWGSDEGPSASQEAMIEIRDMCELAVDRAESHEDSWFVDSTNG